MMIKKIRLSMNMTQKQLAEAIGVDHTIISKYEKGTVMPPAVRLEKMAQIFDVSVDELFGDYNGNYNVVTSSMINPTYGSISLNDDKEFISEQKLVKYLISHNHGCCELCGQSAPFRTQDGKPWLESHYVKWLSQGGSLTVDNMVVLCPNCHLRVHVLNDALDIQYLAEVASKHSLDYTE